MWEFCWMSVKVVDEIGRLLEFCRKEVALRWKGCDCFERKSQSRSRISLKNSFEKHDNCKDNSPCFHRKNSLELSFLFDQVRWVPLTLTINAFIDFRWLSTIGHRFAWPPNFGVVQIDSIYGQRATFHIVIGGITFDRTANQNSSLTSVLIKVDQWSLNSFYVGIR